MPMPRARRVGLAAAVAATTVLSVASGVMAGVPGNHVHVVLERVDDDFTPGANYFAMIDVALPDVAGINSVTLTIPSGPIVLENDGDEWWDGELAFSSFAALKTAMNGAVTIDIAGTSSSTSTFTLDLGTLTDGDLFPLPTMVTPTSGATGVETDVTITWTDPTGAVTPDAVFAEVGNEDDEDDWQEVTSLDGSLPVAATSWTPDDELANGTSEFAIMYLSLDAPRVSPFEVTAGTIAWSSAPEVPPGYPVNTPLFAIGSETIIVFTVGTPCPADVDGNGSVGFSDILAIFGSWGTFCEGCPADLNGDGTVGFADILTLFGSWGPC